MHNLLLLPAEYRAMGVSDATLVIQVLNVEHDTLKVISCTDTAVNSELPHNLQIYSMHVSDWSRDKI